MIALIVVAVRPLSPPSSFLRTASAETTYHVYHVLDGHIFGSSLWQTSRTYTAEEVSNLAATFARASTADEYPYLHEHAQQHVTEGPDREVSAFEFGIDLILDGLKNVRDTAAA